MARTKKQDVEKVETKKQDTEKINITKIKEEIKGYIDSQTKEELKKYVEVTVKKEIDDEIKSTNKKILREKNKKILFRDLIIIILIMIIIALMYLLYHNHYFDKYFTEQNTNNVINTINNQDVSASTIGPTLEDLKKEYGYLLDNININEESNYIDNFYNGDLNSELKNYLVLNTMNFDNLVIEDDYNIIDESSFKEEYSKLFDDYQSTSFSYNDNKVRYINKLDSYLTDSKLVKKSSNIKRDIQEIIIDGNKVSIKTIEYLLKDNKTYNIITNEETEDNFNIITYVFENNKLIKIEKN